MFPHTDQLCMSIKKPGQVRLSLENRPTCGWATSHLGAANNISVWLSSFAMSSIFQQYIGLQSFLIPFDGCIGATVCFRLKKWYHRWRDIERGTQLGRRLFGPPHTGWTYWVHMGRYFGPPLTGWILGSHGMLKIFWNPAGRIKDFKRGIVKQFPPHRQRRELYLGRNPLDEGKHYTLSKSQILALPSSACLPTKCHSKRALSHRKRWGG